MNRRPTVQLPFPAIRLFPGSPHGKPVAGISRTIQTTGSHVTDLDPADRVSPRYEPAALRWRYTSS